MTDSKRPTKSKTVKKRTYQDLVRFIGERSVLKRNVFELGKSEFARLKRQLKVLLIKLHKEVQGIDPRLEVRFLDRNDFECGAIIAGDYLLFHLHTNVFRLDADEASGENKALLEAHPDRAYVAAIHIYNFLADSFRFERPNDAGYLAARIFINAEGQFAAEGIEAIGETFGTFSEDAISDKAMVALLTTIVFEALNFELLVPDYASVAELRLTDAIKTNGLSGQRTSKRMGFRLSTDKDAHSY